MYIYIYHLVPVAGWAGGRPRAESQAHSAHHPRPPINGRVCRISCEPNIRQLKHQVSVR